MAILLTTIHSHPLRHYYLSNYISYFKADLHCIDEQWSLECAPTPLMNELVITDGRKVAVQHRV